MTTPFVSQKQNRWRTSLRLRRWYGVFGVFVFLCWVQVLFLSSGAPTYDDVMHAARSSFSRKHGSHTKAKAKSKSKSVGHRQPSNKASFKRAPPAELDGYTIKPIVYAYPQFHAFPENNQFFGENYTDWDLVNKSIINSHGLKTGRPGKDVGYYDLLDRSTRVRWTNMISESLIYGVAYHHYWFGKPVMHGLLMKMLSDGHPDVPFMLSWANEPWTMPRDGKEVTLLEQKYGGVEEWKRHFEWLTPYFRHVNYIRSRGKVQFIVKNPGHMGAVAKQMFEAWRLWATEDPEIGGLDIIESVTATSGGVRRSTSKKGSDDDDGFDSGPSLWTDAVNEFSTVDPVNRFEYNSWAKSARPHRVFHRGAMVSWDDTPRHLSDNGAIDVPFAHPWLFKAALVRMCHRIMSDPNPRGEENFLFINALNDWANGNALEPSEDWLHLYLENFHDAMQFADENYEWAPRLVAQNLRLSKQVANPEADVDVCIVIREFRTVSPWRDAFTLEHTLESLRDQKNSRWRAVVARVLPEVDARSIEDAISAAHDPRVISVEPPAHLLRESGKTRHGAEITDWAIRNMNLLSPGCARARYLLITNSTNMYEDDTFDAAENDVADVIGLNFESADTMAAYEATKHNKLFYDDRCGRFDHDTALHCTALKPNSGVLDIGAALISMTRWRRDKLSLHEAASSSELGEAGILRRLARHSNTPWSWALPAAPTSDSCNLIRANTRTACIRSGRTWVDVPDTAGFRPGCYNVNELSHAYPGKLVRTTWDYARYRLNPYCLRLSKSLSEEIEKKWREPTGKHDQKTIGKTSFKIDSEKDEKDWKMDMEREETERMQNQLKTGAEKEKPKDRWSDSEGKKKGKTNDEAEHWETTTETHEADDRGKKAASGKTSGKTDDGWTNDNSKVGWHSDNKQSSMKDKETDQEIDETTNNKQGKTSDSGKVWGTEADEKKKDEKTSWTNDKKTDGFRKDDFRVSSSKDADFKGNFQGGSGRNIFGKDSPSKDSVKGGSLKQDVFQDSKKDNSKGSDILDDSNKDGSKKDDFQKDSFQEDGLRKDGFQKGGLGENDSKQDDLKRDDFKKDKSKPDAPQKNHAESDTFKKDGLKSERILDDNLQKEKVLDTGSKLQKDTLRDDSFGKDDPKMDQASTTDEKKFDDKKAAEKNGDWVKVDEKKPQPFDRKAAEKKGDWVKVGEKKVDEKKPYDRKAAEKKGELVKVVVGDKKVEEKAVEKVGDRIDDKKADADEAWQRDKR